MKLSSLRTKSGERVWPEKKEKFSSPVMAKYNESADTYNSGIDAADAEVYVDVEALARLAKEHCQEYYGYDPDEVSKHLGVIMNFLYSERIDLDPSLWLRAKGGE